MKNLRDKTAFITGGASGIGLGIAEALVNQGMQVAIADIDAKALAHAKAHLSAAGARVMTVEMDVATEADWERAAQSAARELGPVSLLCNNAGIGQGRVSLNQKQDLTDIPAALWKLLFDINVGGVYLGVRTFVPRMRQAGIEGHVVNTGSMASFLAPPGLAVYSATKFAVLALSEALRAELMPHRIGVSVLCPGAVTSNLFQRTAEIRRSTLGAGLDGAAPVPPTADPAKMKARSVGERVRQAVENDEFYVITHPEYGALMTERFGSIMAAVGESAEPGYADTAPMLARSRNPMYAELANRLGRAA